VAGANLDHAAESLQRIDKLGWLEHAFSVDRDPESSNA
jgi:hypothetical protein